MNKVNMFISDNTKAAKENKDVNVTFIVKDYITSRQRVKYKEVLNNVYKNIGIQYSSEEMNSYILNILTNLVKENFVVVMDNYYVLSSLL